MTPPSAVIALHGDLTTGKTCLTRGLARAWTNAGLVHSPTFTLVNEYGNDKKLYHLDLYRLGREEELLTLGYEDIVETESVCVIEWADRVPGMLPRERLDIFLEHAGGDHRFIRMVNHNTLTAGWKERLEQWRSSMEKGSST
jgi:tRNA threonylcarbamoyladenosine biosynthesis protein TsaE